MSESPCVNVPQMRPLFGEEERAEILDYLDTDGFFTEFEKTKQFEEMVSRFIGCENCVAVNNGTVSLTLGAIALGVRPGDEVIVPNYTMIATANSVALLGARPVFVDVEPETLSLNLKHVEAAIGPRTRAIMLVSPNGRAPKCGIKPFQTLSQVTGIPIIEDAAQALGSYYDDGRHIGLAGALGSLSFSTSKIISTGQGGAVYSNDTEVVQKIRRLKDFGRTSGGTDIHEEIGYNFKFTELQACVGIAQMRKLKDRLSRKKQIWARYKEHLDGLEEVKLFDHDLNLCTPWFIDCLVEHREKLVDFLRVRGVGTRPMYPPINRQKAYLYAGSFPVSEYVGAFGLWLPSMIQLKNWEIDAICELIWRFYRKEH